MAKLLLVFILVSCTLNISYSRLIKPESRYLKLDHLDAEGSSTSEDEEYLKRVLLSDESSEESKTPVKRSPPLDIGKADNKKADDKNTESEKADSRKTEGGQADSRKPESEKAGGKKPEGEKTDSKKREGGTADDKKAEDEKPDGKKPEGKTGDGKKPEGKTGGGKKPEGETANGKKTESETANGKKPEDEKAEGKKPEGGRAVNKNPDSQKVDGQKVDGQKADDKEPALGRRAEFDTVVTSIFYLTDTLTQIIEQIENFNELLYDIFANDGILSRPALDVEDYADSFSVRARERRDIFDLFDVILDFFGLGRGKDAPKSLPKNETKT